MKEATTEVHDPYCCDACGDLADVWDEVGTSWCLDCWLHPAAVADRKEAEKWDGIHDA